MEKLYTVSKKKKDLEMIVAQIILIAKLLLIVKIHA